MRLLCLSMLIGTIFINRILIDAMGHLRLLDVQILPRPKKNHLTKPAAFDRRTRTLHAATRLFCVTEDKVWFVSPSARLVAVPEDGPRLVLTCHVGAVSHSRGKLLSLVHVLHVLCHCGRAGRRLPQGQCVPSE